MKNVGKEIRVTKSKPRNTNKTRKNWKRRYVAECVFKLVRLFADKRCRLFERKGEFIIHYSIWNGRRRRPFKMNEVEMNTLYSDMYVVE